MILGSWSYVLLSTALALLYPTYCSLKALRTPKKEDDVQWLTYWVVYAIFRTVEFAPDLVLSAWCPLYYELKLGLLFWLISPYFEARRAIRSPRCATVSQPLTAGLPPPPLLCPHMHRYDTHPFPRARLSMPCPCVRLVARQGASVIYIKYLDPWLEKNEAQVDSMIGEAKAKLKTLRSEDLAKYGAMAYTAVAGAQKQVSKAAETVTEKAKEVVAEGAKKDGEETAETDKDK